MKIGVFDSGLGGLIITHSLTQSLPDYDYLYLGDAARVPYGNRSQELIYQFTRAGVEYLFGEGCGLIILACNTASAEALRRLQQEYLPKYYPDRRILGVLIPAAEAAVAATQNGNIGIIATQATITSNAFPREIHKLKSHANIFQQPAPLLVPLIETRSLKWAAPVLKDYLRPLLDQGIDTLILGSTHYPYLKDTTGSITGPGITIIAQDEIIPEKLKNYLTRHPEIEQTLARTGSRAFHVTDLTDASRELATTLYAEPITLQLVTLEPSFLP